jgi:hypothetical protein
MQFNATAAGRLVRPAAASFLTCAALLAGCGGDDDDKAKVDRPFKPATVPSTVATAPAGTVTTEQGAPRKATIEDARRAVSEDRYADAERMFPALTVNERQLVEVRIANRLGRRARSALAEGNRSSVLQLLAQAKKYPATDITRSVAARLKTAERKANEDREKRLLARQQANRERRQRARAKRAADQARKANQQKTTP